MKVKRAILRNPSDQRATLLVEAPSHTISEDHPPNDYLLQWSPEIRALLPLVTVFPPWPSFHLKGVFV
jgi:hypothetical protein